MKHSTYAGTESMGEREDAGAGTRGACGVDSGLGESCSSDGAARGAFGNERREQKVFGKIT